MLDIAVWVCYNVDCKVNHFADGVFYLKDLSISVLFDYYGEALSEKQKQIFDAYYNLDLSLSEIAENMGITRQGVRDFIKRTEQQLLELESNLKFSQKCGEIKKLAEEIKSDDAVVLKLKELISNL